jgi:hypothetical protein
MGSISIDVPGDMLLEAKIPKRKIRDNISNSPR